MRNRIFKLLVIFLLIPRNGKIRADARKIPPNEKIEYKKILKKEEVLN